MAIAHNPIVILGAGATKACGGPLTNEILPEAFRHARQIDPEDRHLPLLWRFLRDNFELSRACGDDLYDYPPLPLLLSIIDIAIDRKHCLGRTWGAGGLAEPEWDASKLAGVRQALDYAISSLLEFKLREIQNHYLDFFGRFVDVYGKPPTVISLNYDIIADNALFTLSEQNDTLQFPDYGCDIANVPREQESKRYGAIYKIHGSLNWMYCPCCHRLELSLSETSSRTCKYLERLYLEQQPRGGDLISRYAHGRSRCSECRAYVQPVMITPTHSKDYRNPHIAQVWYHAERALHRADRAFIIGYSLPHDDVDVTYLLKRGLAHVKPENITVVEHDPQRNRPACEHQVGSRYRSLFGSQIDWQTGGFAGWLNQEFRD